MHCWICKTIFHGKMFISALRQLHIGGGPKLVKSGPESGTWFFILATRSHQPPAFKIRHTFAKNVSPFYCSYLSRRKGYFPTQSHHQNEIKIAKVFLWRFLFAQTIHEKRQHGQKIFGLRSGFRALAFTGFGSGRVSFKIATSVKGFRVTADFSSDLELHRA